MGRLDGKVAVITGAASGIGRATAARFTGEGAAVVIADLNQDGGESAVRDCKEHGGRTVFARMMLERLRNDPHNSQPKLCGERSASPHRLFNP